MVDISARRRSCSRLRVPQITRDRRLPPRSNEDLLSGRRYSCRCSRIKGGRRCPPSRSSRCSNPASTVTKNNSFSIALQVAAQQARQGNKEDADVLKRLVQTTRERLAAGTPRGQAAIPLCRPNGELQGLVESCYPKTNLDSMVLDRRYPRARLTPWCASSETGAILRDHGQVPATRILLVGPPWDGQDDDRLGVRWRTQPSALHGPARSAVQPVLSAKPPASCGSFSTKLRRRARSTCSTNSTRSARGAATRTI